MVDSSEQRSAAAMHTFGVLFHHGAWWIITPTATIRCRDIASAQRYLDYLRSTTR